MIRLLIRMVVFFGSAAVGVLVADAILDQMEVQSSGFLVAVVIYAGIQLVISPVLMKLAAKNATTFLGGTGLLATFIALLAATWWGDALSISGVSTWIAATVIVWFVTALATLLLPFLLLKAGVQSARARAQQR